MLALLGLCAKFYKVSSVNNIDGTEANKLVCKHMNTGESILVFSMSDFYCLQICLQIVINFISIHCLFLWC